LWAGTVSDCLLGPHVLPHRLKSNHRRDFLTWFAKATARCVTGSHEDKYGTCIVLRHTVAMLYDVLSNTCYGRWTAREDPWPSRSPNMNFLDFCLWRHPKPLRATRADNEKALNNCIVDECQTIRNYPGILEVMRWSMMMCVDLCTESYGGHFVCLS
jgi:hypothetical protein